MPNRPMTVSRSVVIAVDRSTVYHAVSDPRETSRWSPENTGARLDNAQESGASDAASLVVGDTFVGSNKRGRLKWVTRCEVTVADRDTAFGFRVEGFGLKEPRSVPAFATWDYRMDEVAGGTELTETWTDLRSRWPDAAARAFDYVVTRGSRFVDFNTRNIETTLANLKRTLESG